MGMGWHRRRPRGTVRRGIERGGESCNRRVGIHERNLEGEVWGSDPGAMEREIGCLGLERRLHVG